MADFSSGKMLEDAMGRLMGDDDGSGDNPFEGPFKQSLPSPDDDDVEFDGALFPEAPPPAKQEEPERERDMLPIVNERAPGFENPPRPSTDPLDRSNWSPEQRRIAGIEFSDEARRREEERTVQMMAASALAPSGARPVRRASDVEADRANRFRQTAELERAMDMARRAADMLAETAQLLAASKDLARRLGNESAVAEAEELESKLQAIEESVMGGEHVG